MVLIGEGHAPKIPGRMKDFNAEFEQSLFLHRAHPNHAEFAPLLGYSMADFNARTERRREWYAQQGTVPADRCSFRACFRLGTLAVLGTNGDRDPRHHSAEAAPFDHRASTGHVVRFSS
jgi:hypothetical protein